MGEAADQAWRIGGGSLDGVVELFDYVAIQVGAIPKAVRHE